jgi:hypothetical protein
LRKNKTNKNKASVQILEKYTRTLIKYKVIYGNCGNLTKGKIFMVMKEYQAKNSGNRCVYFWWVQLRSWRPWRPVAATVRYQSSPENDFKVAHTADLVQSKLYRMPNYAEIMKSLNICVTLYHAYEALIRCGMRAFLNFYEGRNPSLYSIVLPFYPCRAYQQPPPARQHGAYSNYERSARLFGSCARGANLAGRNIRRSKSKITIFESLRIFL